jgi:phosphoribosylformimino-5-aminoimidazole carboxamide ribotide isomerase
MKIVPVVDLMAGAVVRGVGGRRDEYRPIESRICERPTPGCVGAAFKNLGFGEVYVADLDAIRGGRRDEAAYRTLLDCGLDLWLDAGPTSAERLAELAAFTHRGRSLAAIIAGLESLADLSLLEPMLAAAGADRLIFSLDLQSGVPLTTSALWRERGALAIAEEARRLGVRRFIVLDLASVGGSAGVSTHDLCRRLRQADARIEITSGGGVRNLADVHALEAAGCNAALVASALHDGRADEFQFSSAIIRRAL